MSIRLHLTVLWPMNHRLFVRVALAMMAAGSINSAFAQDRFDVWTTENGLPQNSINAILQTRDGYLWLATHDGLVRFDGTHFVIFDKQNTSSIVSNRFTTLFEDRYSNLWAGTEDGSLIQHHNGVFKLYAARDEWPDFSIARLEEDGSGRLLITNGSGVFRLEDGRFNPLLKLDSTCPWQFSNLWWCKDDAALQCIVRGRINRYTKADGLPSLSIRAVIEDQYANLWIDTEDAGLIKLAGKEFIAYDTNIAPPRARFLAQEDRLGNLWLMAPGGLGYLHGGKFAAFDDQYGLDQYSVTALYEDRESNIWIGTIHGLYLKRSPIIQSISQREGLWSNLVYSIIQDHSGAVWVGTWGGGLDRYANAMFTHYHKEDGLVSNRVTALYEDRAGVLWIGTDGGLSHFKDGKLSRYNEAKEVIMGNVWAMHQDRAGALWFGTSGGLIKLRDGIFTRYTTANGLVNDEVTALLEDHAGNLWIGTRNGLNCFTDERFIAYTEAHGLSSGFVRSLYEDRDGTLWVGTYDRGLNRFADGKWTRYTTREGMFNNGVFQILEDPRGNFWMGCNKGIYRASRQELNEFAAGRIRAITCVAYDTKDGMLMAECNGGRQPAGWQMSDGKLWFPTMGGVAVIDPEALHINLAPPPVMIDEFRLDNQPLAWGDGVSIPPDGDHFEIGYKGVSFIKPEAMRFKYRLDGFDQDWVDAGARRTAYYGHVPYGDYTFTVLAANSDGIWNQTGARLRIIVRPHWHQIRWVQALMAVAAMFGATAALLIWHRRRTAQMQKEMALQREFSRTLITFLDRHRQRMSERLHNELKQYLYFIRMSAHAAEADLNHLPGDAAERVQAIAENLEAITQAATKADNETRVLIDDLHPYQLQELGLSRAIECWIEQISKASTVRFACHIDALDGVFNQETEVSVYSILQETINNIVKHAQATAATVTITRGPHAIDLVVEDNGRGFATGEAKAGFGLQMIAERTGMIGGEIVISSTPGQGTKVTIKIGIEQKSG